MIRAGPTGKGVNQETAAETTDETDDSSDRNGGGGLTERDTTDEDDGLHACLSGQNCFVLQQSV